MKKITFTLAIVFWVLLSYAQIAARPDATQKATFHSFKDFSNGNYITQTDLDYMPFIEMDTPYTLKIDGKKYNKPQYAFQNNANIESIIFFDIYKEEIYSIITDNRHINLIIVLVKIFPSGKTESMTYLFLQKGNLFNKIKSEL